MARRHIPIGIVSLREPSARRELVHTKDELARNLSFGMDADLDGVPEPGNMIGNWVKAVFEGAGATAVFAHNLRAQATSSTTPNVSWQIVCAKHSGVGAPAVGTHGGALCLVYEGGAVTSNSIVLALRTAGTRTIDASNPVTVLAFISPVGNW